ncbi:MAG TPA: hypothetical protein VJ890_28250, partial [Vineibacter sp.]|nr:hypothetical protein [Vineibacter sp.]
MPDTDTQDIAARKDAVISRLQSLHDARGAAVLDGRAFDNRQVQRAEAELAALGEAEAVALRRRRAAASATIAARETELKAGI